MKNIIMTIAALITVILIMPVTVHADKWVETKNGYVYKYSNGKTAEQGWLKTSDGTYYIISNGSRKTGWLRFKNGSQYYFDEDGKMVTGVYTVDDIEYKFADDGKSLGKNYHFIVNDGTLCVHANEKCRAAKKISKDNRSVINVGSEEFKEYSKKGYWACSVKGCNDKGTKKSLPKPKSGK